MRDSIDRRAVLGNGFTAAAVTIGAVTLPAHGQPSAPLSAPAGRSPRARRLRDLTQRIDALYASNSPEHEIDVLAREAYTVLDDIEASPGAGLAALEEYSAVVLFWYRPGVTAAGCDFCEGCPATQSVIDLAQAAHVVIEGGANA